MNSMGHGSWIMGRRELEMLAGIGYFDQGAEMMIMKVMLYSATKIRMYQKIYIFCKCSL